MYYLKKEYNEIFHKNVKFLALAGVAQWLSASPRVKGSLV